MEESLNHRLKKGDIEAFSLLFKQTHPRLMGYCRLFVTDNNDVQDLVQDTFLSLWKNREEICLDKSVESLLFISLRNRCINYLKKSNRYSFASLNDAIIPDELQYLYQLDFTEKKEKTIEEDLIEALKQAVNGLPEQQRDIFLKCKIQKQKQKAVAAELGISLKAVEKSLAVSKKKLHSVLSKKFPELIVIISILLH